MLTEKDFIQDTCKATPGFEYYPKKFIEINVSKLLIIIKNTTSEEDAYIFLNKILKYLNKIL